MSEETDTLARLTRAAGISESYTDQFGDRVETSPETRRAILKALGLEAGTEAEAQDSLQRLSRLRGLIAPLLPVEAGRPARVPLKAAAGSTVEWRLADETGGIREGRAAAEGQGGFDLPALAIGYYALSVETAGERAAATVIAAPPRCFQPRDMEGDARLWGVTAQVYGLSSPRNLGIGDFSDVRDAAAGSGALGASFLGLSPLHALFSADRSKISPYSPSSRLFLEPLFLDPAAIEGFAGGPAAALLEEDESRRLLEAARGPFLVDHPTVWALKSRLLEALWAGFRERADHAGLDAFRREGGAAIEGHATFEALHEHFWAEGRYWLGEWPADYHDPGSWRVKSFASDRAERVAFHAWLQWECDKQLGAAHAAALGSGMGLGLYRDLAVGADRGGSEIWVGRERFAPTLSVGAPPDPLGPMGQNWGLPPFNPLTLEAEGLAAFRDLITANMRHCGAIRIDHAFQLQRLFLIPEGEPARHGAYVDYPFEALLAVLRLESHRARCLVIAEDLGNAPEGFSDAIMASDVLSYRLLSFERHPDASFKLPSEYPRRALAAVTTHDLPTFRGWWRGLDIDLRQTLGLYDAVMAERERAIRREELQHLTNALVTENLLAEPTPPEEPPLEAAVRFLARSRAALAALQFEEPAGELNQANLPGVQEGHPNWRRKLAVDVADLTAPGGELAKLAAAIASEGRGEHPSPAPLASPPPRATYRVQFHKDFTLDQAAAIVPYLAELGVSHLYASPILQARPGSTHGYDIVNHAAINPELGGEAAFTRLSEALQAHGLGLILDIVPNHMGVGGSDNAWWLSTLEWGELSPAAKYFDIDWGRLGAGGKIIVPFLGDRYGDALEKGDLKLSFDEREGSFSVWHYEHRFPVCPLQYPMILERAVAAMPETAEESARAEMFAVSERLRAMGEESASERRAGFVEESEGLKDRLRSAVARSPELHGGIDRAVALLNGAPGMPESFGTLHRILEAQAYRLAYWRVAASDINYRRFFDINSLAGLRTEEPELFERSHELIFRLVREGRIQGLRIDHIDGLADPDGYLRQLQGAVGPGFYVVVEKILEHGEHLRGSWPVAGTTGYEVLNLLDGVFVDGGAKGAIERIYREFSGLEGSYPGLLRSTKAEILELSFSSELEVLVSDLKRIADVDRRTRDMTTYAIRRALIEIISRFPIYRTYVTDGPPSPEDREKVEHTIRRAKRTSELPDRSVHDFMAAALLNEIETEGPGRPDRERVRRFRTRFQQLTGPVMAKSLEDTLFYRYFPLVSLNEVGGDPGHFGVGVEEFHGANRERAGEWPDALVASATHDTKRGEDARARLNALSEMPAEWSKALASWREVAVPHLRDVEDEPAPDANDQYLILQALLGAWPVELLERNDPAALEAFRGRIEEYVLKALREAKRHTSWVHTREPYEEAALGLVRAVLDPTAGLLDGFRPLARRLAGLGALTSLARTVLKCTVPGVPDIYQGTGFWDLSLVDPDNRRPVDYDASRRALEGTEDLGALLQNWPDGRIKARLLARLLAHRAESPQLYAEGDYSPVQPEGARAGHLIAFTRGFGTERLLVVVPRLLGGLVPDGRSPTGDLWAGTVIPGLGGAWRDVITGREHEARGDGGGLAVDALLSTLPVAVLTGG